RVADEASVTGEPWMTGEPRVAPGSGMSRTSAMSRTAVATNGGEGDGGYSKREDQRRHGRYDCHKVLQRKQRLQSPHLPLSISALETALPMPRFWGAASLLRLSKRS